MDGYFSIRKRANPEAVAQIEAVYAKLREAERSGKQLRPAIRMLKAVLDGQHAKFNDLMTKLQSGTATLEELLAA